ncbi:unnamed protein product [Linum tenue]|uniref:RING-CH-type domain-containing protein n=1 Tax=Linum tenue TaxID=586396 RepID=A0AAV0M759_9ROSI|nr:unnamed protein product [Linum tenue]
MHFSTNSTLSAMQLVSHDSHNEDISESEPILSHSDTSPQVDGSSSSRDITTLERDSDVHGDDFQSVFIDETCLLVNSDQPQCRICLDCEGDDLIAPCHCKGTQKYVHRSCLDNWRSTKEGFAFAHCTECRALFVLRANVPPDRWWLRLKFQFLVARDHAFIFIAVQLIVAILGVLVYRFYGEELREMFGYEEHPYGFYTMGGMYSKYNSFGYCPCGLALWFLHCHNMWSKDQRAPLSCSCQTGANKGMPVNL